MHKKSSAVNILAVDIGNTFTKAALFVRQRMAWHVSEPTDALLNKTGAAKWIQRLQENTKMIDAIGVSSVVPEATKHIIPTMKTAFETEPICVSTHLSLPFRIRYQTPETLGADRLAFLARAAEHYQDAVIAINFGTAITYDVLTSAKKSVEERAYLGGMILAGIGLRSSALHEHTAQLPSFGFQPMKTPIGTSTQDCLTAGLYFGTISETNGVIAQLKKRLKELGEKKVVVVAAGGDSKHIAKSVSAIDAVEPDAVLRGVRRLVELQYI